MANKSIKKNYIYNLLQQILSVITPLITIPYISRIIGAEGIGIFSYTNSIVCYFAMFAALGTAIYGQREISYVQDNREKRTQIFWNTEIRCIITTLICLIVYFAFVSFQSNYKIIYTILSITIIEVALNVNWLFMGMEEFGVIVKCNILVRIVNIAFIFLFVKTADDLPIYVFGLTVIAGLGNLCLWFLLPKFVGKPKLKDLHPFKDFKVVLSLFIPTIAISIYTVLDKTMIGILTQNAAENGFYEQAIKMSKITLMFVTSLGVVMVPRIGFHFEKKDYDQIRQFMYRSYRFVGFLGIPLCFGLIGTASNFVPWFYGPGFSRVIPLIIILSFLILAIGTNNVTGVQYLIPTKRQNVFTKTVLLGALVNFISNLILIPSYGALGAAFASVLAETVITLVQLFIVRKELSFYLIIRNSVKYVGAGSLMLAALWITSRHIEPSIYGTLILIVEGCCIYFATLWALRDDFFKDNLQKIFVKLKKHS